MLKPKRNDTHLPGLRLSLSYTLLWLAFVVLLPLAALFANGGTLGFDTFTQTLTNPRVVAAFSLSLGLSAASASLNCAFGLVVAWVLTRYQFYGRRIIDALIDLPFALPTAVAGIALTAVYGENGFFGRLLLSHLGIRVAYTRLGIVMALVFIGLPFVVRTVQPVLQDMDPSIEEAAATLGANRWQTFWRVIFPSLSPALATGFTLAFARGLGEFGSVVFISGNMPFSTEMLPLLIMTKLEQYDYGGATVLAIAMLTIAAVILLVLNALARWRKRWTGERA